jgi:uncharacterized cupredoxin-like copper-binding protein
MKLNSIAAVIAACLSAVVHIGLANANSLVFVTTYDKGGAAPMATDHGLGMANMKMASAMGLHISTPIVKAGEVTFKLKNSSNDLVHEMLVFPYSGGANLPYNDKQVKIDEENAKSLGEVSETDPGKGGELKLTLQPGKYVLLCNLPGHFANGMWTILTVN